MRSASYSFSRVKLICDWIASACPEAIAAEVACPDDDELGRAMPRSPGRGPASMYSSAFFSFATDARHVALRDVRDFVRQHRCELGFALREQDEAACSRRHSRPAARTR